MFHVIFTVNTCVSITPCTLHALIAAIACIQGMQVKIYSICPVLVLPADNEGYCALRIPIFYSNDYKQNLHIFGAYEVIFGVNYSIFHTFYLNTLQIFFM